LKDYFDLIYPQHDLVAELSKKKRGRSFFEYDLKRKKQYDKEKY